MSGSQTAFSFAIPSELERDIQRLNPWWADKPLPELPDVRRHLVSQIRRRLDNRSAPIVVVRGPRQIGKTTACLQLIQQLLSDGIEPKRILRIQFDELPSLEEFTVSEPILRLVEWYESGILGQTLNEAARSGKRAFLFFDEVQNIEDWATQLKFLVDASTVHVCLTGSSALRIERGRDSLAGRMTTIEAGVLSLTEIARLHHMPAIDPFLPDNGLEPLARKEFWVELRSFGSKRADSRDQAFARFSERGGYPLVHKLSDLPWSHLADQLNETVIKRVIQHDLRVGERGRKRDSALLEEIFRLCCRYAGQSPTLQLFARETQRVLQANVGVQRINTYLRFLGDTLLVRLIPPLEIRLKKKKGNHKICLADHGLRASWLQEQIPLIPHTLGTHPELSMLAGHLAESVVGAALSTINGLDTAHLPARDGEPEVDFVLTIGVMRIPLEVKYQSRLDPLRDTEGLRSFLEKSVNNAPFAILITQSDGMGVDDPRIVTLPLSTFLLMR